MPATCPDCRADVLTRAGIDGAAESLRRLHELIKRAEQECDVELVSVVHDALDVFVSGSQLP